MNIGKVVLKDGTVYDGLASTDGAVNDFTSATLILMFGPITLVPSLESSVGLVL